MESTLTPDTQAVLLLCAELGQRGGNGLKPRGLRQYNVLASWLKSQSLRPGDLLSADCRIRLEGFLSPEVDLIRGTHLLDRGAALALILVKERTDEAARATNETPVSAETSAETTVPPFLDMVKPAEETTAPAAAEQCCCDAYSLVIDQMLILLKEPRTSEWLADKMRVRPLQIKDWLARGVLERRITKQKKPVRYVAHSPALFTD